MYLVAAPLATTFASSLAWLIIKFAKSGPIAPWRLLFIIEGFPSVVIAVLAWHVIPDSPQTARYLSPREKKVARLRLRNEKSANEKGKANPRPGLKGRELLAVFRDPVAWTTAAMFFLTNMAYSSLPVFLPKILTEMGHDVISSQALSAPPYLLAFIIVLVTAHLSDKSHNRAIPIAFHAASSAAGYAVLALAQPLSLAPIVRYLAVYPAAIGFFNVVTLIIAWSINNQSSESRQGGGFAMMQLVGQCGPLVGTRLYPDREAPFYMRGMQACAWAMLAVSILAVCLRLYLRYMNRRMDGLEAARSADGVAVEEEEGLVGTGVRKRTPAQKFRYML
jgi:cyanate permease